jgi:ABC-type transport system substrate-binding protein
MILELGKPRSIKEVKHVKKIFIIALTVLVITALFLTGCGEETTTPSATTTTTTTSTSTSDANAPQDGGTLRIIGTEAPTGSIGVPEHQLGLAWGFMMPMIEPLAIWTAGGDMYPRLMKSFEWSDDYLSVTINLQQNVKFHDGTDFNAEVCKWNLEKHTEAGMDGMENVASMEIIDTNTIKINVIQYQNTWFSKLGGATGGMISPAWYDEKGAEYVDWHPVGTGPFKFVEYKDKEYLLLERNDNYWNGKAHLDQIKYIFIADSVTAQISFESGEGDTISLMSGGPKMATELGPKGYSVTANPGGLCMCFIPPVTNPDSPLTNLKVREAMEYAIDKKANADKVGSLFLTLLPVCARHSFFRSKVPGRVYDPRKPSSCSLKRDPDGFKKKIIAGSQLAGDEIAFSKLTSKKSISMRERNCQRGE